MHTSLLLGGLALLLRRASAIPAPTDAPEPPTLLRRDGELVDGLSPWVSVNDEAQPVATYTPSMTTVSGTPSAVDGAPEQLTASVFTWTSYAKVTTSTGLPPNPTAARRSGEGAFSRCRNMDGEFAPICRPSHNTTLLTGHTYYITWDPDYFNTTDIPNNSTVEVAIRLDWFNHTDRNPSNWGWLHLDTYNRVPAAWGFWTLDLTTSYLKDTTPGHTMTNVSISLVSSISGSNEKNTTAALPVAFMQPGLPPVRHSPGASRESLIIGLPIGFGALVLVIGGLFLYNRRTRRIGLGNVMGRKRNGYDSSRTRRMFRRAHKDGAIQLTDRASPPIPEYHDNPSSVPRIRRDSDLGSLAGSPVVGSFSQTGTLGGRNAFRDEVDRQNEQRRAEREY
ncbi:hypothetical protein S40285_05248 [Stachybotrys chlorohalonatus IBT 40285]|uniref:Mid2 domain-containing protein n=1 Tax=Stachybotrys chlorohalonatus (strain IBT 40285) TaxID=1283841 RepID=A0A084QT78_STAC4|nr:hypothetical protein S40285_05248 [Stachybotrys chlorohalonata IBT 40285]